MALILQVVSRLKFEHESCEVDGYAHIKQIYCTLFDLSQDC